MTNRTKTTNHSICIAILTIATIIVMLFFSSYTPKIYGESISNDDIAQYDPFYPKAHEGVDYTLSVPTLENRLTLSEDKKTASLFAPYTSKSKGWYDVNKWFNGGYNDSQLCWAASNSNVIAWYLDVMSIQGMDTSSYDTDLQAIFNKFRANWAREGYDPLMGFSWYFTGQFPMGGPPANLINEASGGYLKDVRGVGEDSFFELYLGNTHRVFGNYETKFPFVEDLIGNYSPDTPLYNHETFSKYIIEQLHYGATVITINKENAGSMSHAITLWGADYDTKTGLISKLYVTDSDDSVGELVELKVSKRPGDKEGIKINMYPKLGSDSSPFTRVTSSTLLYAPNVVNRVEPPCTHNYVPSYDAMHHFDKCTICGDIKDKVAHTFGEWTEETAPTCTTLGKEYRECSCGYKEYRDKAMIEHDFVAKEDGSYTWQECKVCGFVKDKTAKPTIDLTPPETIEPEVPEVIVPTPDTSETITPPNGNNSLGSDITTGGSSANGESALGDNADSESVTTPNENGSLNIILMSTLIPLAVILIVGVAIGIV